MRIFYYISQKARSTAAEMPSPKEKILFDQVHKLGETRNTSFKITRIDDDLAQVWTDYAFYAGEKFSHCGIDAFQLIRGSDGRWRIINLIDTRRQEPCERP